MTSTPNQPPRRTTVSAQGLSRLLASAGVPRATKVDGGRGGVLSPIHPGFKVWNRSFGVLLDYLPHDADERDAQLDAIAEKITAEGYAVTKPARGEGLEIRVLARTNS